MSKCKLLFSLYLLFAVNVYSNPNSNQWNVESFDHTTDRTQILLTKDIFILEYMVTRSVSPKEAQQNFHTYLKNIIENNLGAFYGRTISTQRNGVRYAIVFNDEIYIAITTIHSPFSNTVVSNTLMIKVPPAKDNLTNSDWERAEEYFNNMRNIPNAYIEKLLSTKIHTP